MKRLNLKSIRMAAVTLMLTILISITFLGDAFACTSAIFTGKVTKDGRPLMWKNRDTGELNNRLEYFKGPLFGFVGLVNSPSKGGEAWAGSNEVGFCIMNTASYNIDLAEDRKLEKDGEGVLMYRALGVCKTLQDFEHFLDTMTKPAPIEANFGVIDAFGGAAYYEVNSRTWTKLDVNDPKVAPNGYFVVTNFSFTGREDEGMGYIRYTSAQYLVDKAFSEGIKFTPQWIIYNLSRSFYHSQLGVDVVESGIVKQTNGWFIDQDFIPRKSTSAISIFQGVNPGEDPGNTIYWCALGYGPLAVCIPVIMKYLPDISCGMVSLKQMHNQDKAQQFLNDYKGLKKNYSILNFLSLQLKKKVFPIKRGNGNKYININLLFNDKGTGYTQELQKVENKIFTKTEAALEKLRKGENLTKEEVHSLYNYKEVLDTYNLLLRGF